mgnify:CR=1 FL=1
MRRILFILIILANITCFAQPLVLQDNVHIAMTGGVSIVVNPTSANAHQAILLTGTKEGYITSDGDDNEIIWWLRDGGNTEDITVPFGIASGNNINIVLSNITAGSNDGAIIFSTAKKDGTFPFGVTNLNDIDGNDNSANVIDRYWYIEFRNYTTKPIIDEMTLQYSNSEIGTIPEDELQAQYWYNSEWVYPSTGVANTASNVVNSIVNLSTDEAVWVLVNKNYLLPVELLSFDYVCIDNGIKLLWKTASEANNSFFTVFVSANGSTWRDITSINGAGWSSNIISYETIIYEPTPIYIKLSQTDFDGKTKEFETTFVDCEQSMQDNKAIKIYSDGILFSHLLFDKNVDIKVYNSTGQLIYSGSQDSMNNIVVVPGIYYLQIIR